MSDLTGSPEQSTAIAGPYCEVLGEVLRDLRALRGLPLRETATAVGVAESTLSRYELGNRKPPFAVLVKLAEFYETSLFVLLLFVARIVSPDAVLPEGEQAALLWVLLRYDEAQPPNPT